jgi:hypothetical protein
MKVVIVGVAVLALMSAAAAGASRSRAASFCSVSNGVAKTLSNLQKTLQSAPTPVRLKAEWGEIDAAAPSLKSSAPGNLKAPMTKVLGVAGLIETDLKKANWQVAGLLPYESSLEVQMNKAKPSLNALDAYWRGTCKFKV